MHSLNNKKQMVSLNTFLCVYNVCAIIHKCATNSLFIVKKGKL